MSVPPTVLIFTLSEYGQANVNIATAYELALSGANVSIASLAPLKTRVSHLQELVVRHASRYGGKPTGSVSFHELRGLVPYKEAALKKGDGSTNFTHPHGVLGALRSYALMETLLFPWSNEEYLATIESCKEIITTVKPNVVAVDYAADIALDACKLVDQKFVIISPNSIKELAGTLQPYLAELWKYPAISSGFSFPLKWWRIPLNICLNIRLAIHIGTSARIREFQALRASIGLNTTLSDLFSHVQHGIAHICPALVETDYPFAVIPEQIHLCGPIVVPFDPVEKSDPTLAAWLGNGPTVIINLGSHTVFDERAAKEMATAFRALLDYHDKNGASKIQVLWKAMASVDIQTAMDDMVGKEVKEGRVKVLPWLDAEPISILQHPNVICTVHHGGANSFYEGVWSGVPHIVLPAWYDTYEYASRVEYLNLGIFGNKTCAPGVRAREFGDALVRVTGGTGEAAKFKRAAKHLQGVCRAKGNGRQLAAMAILREAGINR